MAEAMADGELDTPAADSSLTKTLDQAAHPASWRDAPVARQVAVVVVLAAAIAFGVAAALWSGETPMTPLFADMAPAEMGKVSDALKASNTEFRIDPATGALLVPAENAQAIRMQLASQGLPETGGPVGLEMLSEQQDLSTSQFVENARYLHALETELARSVSSLRNVKSARVHLALPKESVFVRRRTPPSASVVVALYRGRKLSQEHVASIVNLVSASVPSMNSDHVTVVDQHGSLLTENNGNKDLQNSTREYDYTRRLEADYAARIVNLLEPVVGAGRVRAQVTAELDFNRTEVTSEAYEPEGQVVRSEQIAESESSAANALGIPGALTNQPPGEGTTDAASAEGEGGGGRSGTQSRNATRNYEVDRTISHTRRASGAIQRLAIAVVIDNKPAALAGTPDGAAEGEEGAAAAGVYTEDEIARLTNVVRDAIGFSADRGDSLSVINSPFHIEEMEPLPSIPLIEQAWFQQLIKQVLAGIFIFALLYFIVRPIVRALLPMAVDEAREEEEVIVPAARIMVGDNGTAFEVASNNEEEVEEPLYVVDEEGRMLDPRDIEREESLRKRLLFARALVEEDPARAANVLRSWMKLVDDPAERETA